MPQSSTPPYRLPTVPSGARSPGARDVHAQRIMPTLHRQRWSLDGAQPGALSRAIHLSSGRGVVSHAQGEIAVRAPDIVWLPAGAAREVQIDAGSAGVTVGVSDALLAAAMGERDDAAPLRQVSTRMCIVTAPDGAPRDEIVRSLLAMEAEARSGTGGLRPYLAAHLTIVLVAMWRLSSREGGHAMDSAPEGHRLLRFRHLVEAQFRAHWPVSRYAKELGISPDRLHDLCVSTLERAPLALVHQRVLQEACSLLAGTDLSVERLAGDLGFSSASHFSRFFKRWMDTGPRDWRRQVRHLAAAGLPQRPVSYADWP